MKLIQRLLTFQRHRSTVRGQLCGPSDMYEALDDSRNEFHILTVLPFQIPVETAGFPIRQ